MKTILLYFLALSSLAMANVSTPLDAVKAMIRGANERQIVGVNLETVGMTAEQIVSLFNDVDADKASILDLGKEPNKEDGNYHLRMGNPMCIGFEVRFVKDVTLESKGYYEVVKIQL